MLKRNIKIKLAKLLFINCKIKSTIISNDCFGGELYKFTKSQYRTPFVGLMIMAPDYLNLLENFFDYMNKEITFIHKSKYDLFKDINYPLGVLGGDIEIHFLHYKTEEEVLLKWNDRVKRIDYNNLYFKFDSGKDYSTNKLAIKFCSLPYPNKLCIVNDSYYNDKFTLKVDHYNTNAVTLFYNTLYQFNYINWANGKNPKFNKFKQKLIKFLLTN